MAPPDRAQRRPQHIPELDGVRGLAVLLVVIFHFGIYSKQNPALIDKAFLSIIGLGWTGVDLFFVLSGCLITGILLNAKGSANYFRSFYMRRVLRILPLYYTSVFLFFCVAIPLSHSLGLAATAAGRSTEVGASEQIWYWLHVSNWSSAFGTLAYSPVGHFWSLAIEEQFYFVWPVLVLLLSESALLRTCLAIAAASLLLRNIPAFQAEQSIYTEFLYRLTPFRLEPIALGSAIAVLLRSRAWRIRSRSIAGVAAAGLALTAGAILQSGSVWYTSPGMTRYGYAGIALSWACLVFYAVAHSGSRRVLPRVFRNPVLAAFGRYSYAIYVVHIPIGHVVFRIKAIPENIGGALIHIVLGVGLSFLVALCSWHLMEKHFLKLKDRFSAGKVRAQSSTA